WGSALLWGGALWRGRIRLLAPLHELLEQLVVLFGRCWRARRRGGEKGLELVDRGLLRALAGCRQRVLDRLCEVGERRRLFTFTLARSGHGDDEEQRHERCDADGGGEARRDGPQRLFRLPVGVIHDLGIEGVAQRVGYRTLELGVERHRRKRLLQACSARSRPLTQRTRRVVQGIARIEMVLLAHT